MDDIELVREYAAEKSESAFKTLVERHLPLVYSAALRQVRNPAMAEDISQVAFLLLAHKAAKLPGKTIVAGWLYRTTCHLASKALRQESRRRHREQEALSMQNDYPDTVKTSNAPPQLALVPPRSVPVRPTKATNGPVNPPLASSDDQSLSSADAARQQGISGYGISVRRHGPLDPTNNDELAHFQYLPEVQRVQTWSRVTISRSPAPQKKN